MGSTVVRQRLRVCAPWVAAASSSAISECLATPRWRVEFASTVLAWRALPRGLDHDSTVEREVGREAAGDVAAAVDPEPLDTPDTSLSASGRPSLPRRRESRAMLAAARAPVNRTQVARARSPRRACCAPRSTIAFGASRGRHRVRERTVLCAIRQSQACGPHRIACALEIARPTVYRRAAPGEAQSPQPLPPCHAPSWPLRSGAAGATICNSRMAPGGVRHESPRGGLPWLPAGSHFAHRRFPKSRSP